MKRILLALAIFALVLPAAPQAEARVDVSINFFYDNLGDDGYWLDVDGYGYCWQPTVAVSNRSWRPYSDGYWAYTDVGWTWVSYEPFGWATYHYGRWARLRNHGWVWVPGYEWGPAWVSWRTGGNYVGWAPLPPRHGGRGEVVYSGRPISGYVDIDFDIGPSYYNFVDIRYIGAPVLSRHIYASTQNITYINQTVNVTNITYNNNVVHNYGPDYSRLSAYSTQPIQRLSLQRSTDFAAAAQDSSRGFNRVQGNQLIVAAPARMEAPEQPVAPPKVKTKVEEPNIETGWSDITDEKARAQLREKFKKEDRKSIPPPEIPPQNRDEATAAADTASPAPAGSPTAADVAATAGGAPEQPGPGRGRSKLEKVTARPQQPDDTASPADRDDRAAPADQRPNERARGKNRRDARPAVQQPQVPLTPADERRETAGGPAADQPAEPTVDRKGRGKNRQVPVNVPPPSTADGPAATPAAAQEPEEKGRGDRGPKQKRERPDRGAAQELDVPDRAPTAPAAVSEPVRQRVAPQEDRPAPAPDARGRGRKVQRDVPDAVLRPQEPAPRPERPARVRELPPQAPPQMAPPRAPQEAAAPPQQGRGGGRPDRGERGDRGRGKEDKDEKPEKEQEP